MVNLAENDSLGCCLLYMREFNSFTVCLVPPSKNPNRREIRERERAKESVVDVHCILC